MLPTPCSSLSEANPLRPLLQGLLPRFLIKKTDSNRRHGQSARLVKGAAIQGYAGRVAPARAERVSAVSLGYVRVSDRTNVPIIPSLFPAVVNAWHHETGWTVVAQRLCREPTRVGERQPSPIAVHHWSFALYHQRFIGHRGRALSPVGTRGKLVDLVQSWRVLESGHRRQARQRRALCLCAPAIEDVLP